MRTMKPTPRETAITRGLATLAHQTLMSFKNEPMDGDEVDSFVKHFKAELNFLNGNTTAEEKEIEKDVLNKKYTEPTVEGIYCPFCETFVRHKEDHVKHVWDCPECLFYCKENKV